MSRFALLLLLLPAFHAQAYSGKELLEDCRAAEAFYTEAKADSARQSPEGIRCMQYLEGFADGYRIGEYLADKVGIQLNAFCLPEEENRPYRMLRAVLAHLEKQPPNAQASSRTLVAGALAKAFSCEK